MKYGNTSKIFKVLHNSCSGWSRFLWCPSTWLHRNSPTRAQNTQKCSWLSWHVATHLGTIPLVPSNLFPSLYNWDILGYRAQALLQDLSLHQILLGSSLRSLVKNQILQGMVPPWEVRNSRWFFPQRTMGGVFPKKHGQNLWLSEATATKAETLLEQGPQGRPHTRSCLILYVAGPGALAPMDDVSSFVLENIFAIRDSEETPTL